jgi:histidinol-phosphate aminotransferase
MPEGRAGKLRLDFNENTAGCSPAVVRALARLTPERLAMYPEYRTATARLARHFGVQPAELLLTNGIDDGLRLIVDAYIDPRDAVLVVEPTFDMYRFYSNIAVARVTSLRYDREMRFPLADVLHAFRGRKRGSRPPRAFFLANPNNPTGSLVAPAALRQILKAAPRTLVLIDEAYFEFSGVTVLPWIRRYPNLIVARTFSKAMGLASLRLGCLFANREVIATLQKASSPFPVNTAALVAAEAACRDRAFVRNYVREIRHSREELERGLTKLGIHTFQSAANFLLADFGPRAPAILRKLARQGILLRDRTSDFGRPGYVRITIGTRAQTRRLLRAIAKLW